MAGPDLSIGAEVKFRSVLQGHTDAEGVVQGDLAVIRGGVVNGEPFTWEGVTFVPVYVPADNANVYVDSRNIVEES